MKVLVTGGAGFIGSHLVDALMERGYRVRVLDDLSAGSLKNIEQWLDNSRFEFIKGDMRDPNIVKEAVEDVDIVYHLAANPEVRISAQSPELLYETNVLITYNLLQAIKDSNVKYLIFTSSSTVYGDAKVIPTPEDYGPLEPISVYGGAKLAAEALISGYAHIFEFHAVVFRLANIIGARANHGVIYDFINKLKKNPEVLEILGDGTQRKSYLHVSDTVEGMLHIFEYFKKEGKIYDVYNLGNEDWITVKEIAEIVSEEMGLNPEFRFTGGVDGGRGWKGDVKFMLLDITKAKSTGWKPKMNSYEAVRRTVRELLKA
ncbi:UDP-glucose 4-epimerase [Pyrococcus furiosus DSM 3638]|uniref:UDP-or dTTP-glucose 4-epimerase or 4-6-dehydratase n=3 Tax=Pyrococcus furiosus TaxID=2261 RepID=Q8U3Q4_PYRFU|nr:MULTISPECIES: NAD-dependent epimerase/dehydratase family protein [Pyrococcus]AAL80526.1 UDP- or dTTP-glucose 4-epimerase or 4-6-dehydratase [Pyrococcus furiosus DSM 3638]AFN03193.1 UDP- or dTTP-glucose 4-epimerase or 4-6-dehydratase [Pyrococcus furiosus COM1]MDK2869266.1 UDP-glucose 4-epimerase [Pyrococcus sp.]QEK78118.1 UDP-glucose 4-epimerase [Pyrococcus furiosus DSM 3638]